MVRGLTQAKTVLALAHHVSTLTSQRKCRSRLSRVGEEYHLSNSYDNINKSDDEDDAGIFSIANDYSSEDDDTLADEQN